MTAVKYFPLNVEFGNLAHIGLNGRVRSGGGLLRPKRITWEDTLLNCRDQERHEIFIDYVNGRGRGNNEKRAHLVGWAEKWAWDGRDGTYDLIRRTKRKFPFHARSLYERGLMNVLAAIRKKNRVAASLIEGDIDRHIRRALSADLAMREGALVASKAKKGYKKLEPYLLGLRFFGGGVGLVSDCRFTGTFTSWSKLWGLEAMSRKGYIKGRYQRAEGLEAICVVGHGHAGAECQEQRLDNIAQLKEELAPHLKKGEAVVVMWDGNYEPDSKEHEEMERMGLKAVGNLNEPTHFEPNEIDIRLGRCKPNDPPRWRRFDYIYCSPEIEVDSAEVVRQGAMATISNHWLIRANLRVPVSSVGKSCRGHCPAVRGTFP